MSFKLEHLLRNAVYTALYVVLCYIFQPISFYAVQVRIAEALCIMPIFDDLAIISITLGCFISNFMFSGLIDAIFGTLATFLGLICIKFIKTDNFFIKMFPTILSNTVILPIVFKYAFSESMPIYMSGIYIAIGEILSIYVLGFILYNVLKKYVMEFKV